MPVWSPVLPEPEKTATLVFQVRANPATLVSTSTRQSESVTTADLPV